MRALLTFIGYVIAINTVWSLATGNWTFNAKDGFLLAPVIYIYNVVFFLVALLMYQRHGARFLWLTVQVTTLSLVAQVGLSFVYSSGGGRETLLFDSPNQLGYFAVLGASVVVMGQRRLGVSFSHSITGLLAATYLGLLSQSKAALGAIGILMVLGMFNRARSMVATGLLFGALLAFSNPVSDALTNAVDRIENDETMGFFEERGYDRIVNHPEHWFLGAGEGGTRRFRETTLIGAREIHSSAGTLFFCYGIIGSALFCMFAYRVVEGTGVRLALTLAPAAAYGLTHQSLRFTYLWALLALAVALKDVDRANRQARQAARQAARDARDAARQGVVTS
jgi:hypothetical protein